MANHAKASEYSETSGEHGHSAMRYYASFAALFVFTVLTYALHHVDLGHLALPIAMLIATGKALVVVLFFMHLWDHPGVNRLVFGVTMLLLFFAILMVFADVFTRYPLAVPHYPAPTLPLQK